MTAKRDLKKRVRERQAKTGESYVTARRHVVGAAAAKPRAFDVIEMIDVTSRAAELGLRCTIRITPQLATLGDEVVLARLHEVLIATSGDPTTHAIRRVALDGARLPATKRPRADVIRRFLKRAQAGLGGASDDGTLFAFPIATGGTLRNVLCLARSDRSLSLMTIEEQSIGGPLLANATPHVVFLIFEGRRYPIGGVFTIGRSRDSDLQIRDGTVSRKHAVVVRRGDAFYLKDAQATNGVLYKGYPVDNKRIEEGDVFKVGDYSLAFTFVPSD